MRGIGGIQAWQKQITGVKFQLELNLGYLRSGVGAAQLRFSSIQGIESIALRLVAVAWRVVKSLEAINEIWEPHRQGNT